VVYGARPKGRLPRHPNQARPQIEDGLPDAIRLLRVPRDAVRPNQRNGKLLGLHQQGPRRLARRVLRSLSRRYPNLQRHTRGKRATFPDGTRATAKLRVVRLPEEVQVLYRLSRVPGLRR
jgi:hypothetical protein